jgi:aminopeptidase N
MTPIVDTAVKDNYMQLLNANSYQKGGWVLHMLRRKLGDVLFWKGVSAYYAKYNGGNANTDDLRLVMEQVSGKNLKPFFKQWLKNSGHPDLEINYSNMHGLNRVEISITQTQPTLYQFPLEFSLNGTLHTIEIKNRKTEITIPLDDTKEHLIFDPNINLLFTSQTHGLSAYK